jgi:hypothetical protein
MCISLSLENYFSTDMEYRDSKKDPEFKDKKYIQTGHNLSNCDYVSNTVNSSKKLIDFRHRKRSSQKPITIFGTVGIVLLLTSLQYLQTQPMKTETLALPFCHIKGTLC